MEGINVVLNLVLVMLVVLILVDHFDEGGEL